MNPEDLTDNNEPLEEEEIPVEIEVVEVEQDGEDDPIKVQIEAPFEPPLLAPRRIRVPRNPRLIKVPRQERQSTADRMAAAFDSNMLEPLLEAIRNPSTAPAPTPRPRKQLKVLSQKKKAVKYAFDSEDPWKAKTLSGFIGLKLKRTYNRAAVARRAATDAGADTSKTNYFLKAAAFEFGGDRVARAKGRFSKKPAAVNDPALNADQRYMAGVDTTPAGPEQGELFNTVEYEKSVKGSFARLDKKLRSVLSSKKGTPQPKFDKISKLASDIKESLVKNNKQQEKNNKVQQKQLDLLQDSVNDAEMAAKAAAMREGEDLSGLEQTNNPYRETPHGDQFKLPRIPRWRKWWKKWSRRLRNPGRTARAFGRLMRGKASGLLRKIPGMRGLADKVSKIRMPRLSAPKLPNLGLDKLKNIRIPRPSMPRMPSMGNLGSRLLNNPIARLGGRLSRGAGRAIPLLGTAAGVATTAERTAMMNDPEFQKMVAEKKKRGEKLTELEMMANPLGVTTGALSAIPAIGLPVVAGEMLAAGPLQDFGLSRRREQKQKREDLLNMLGGGDPNFDATPFINTPDNPVEITQGRDRRNIFQKMGDSYNNFIYGTNKMSEGGVMPSMMGEAGPELFIRGGSKGGGLNPFMSLGTIASAADIVTKGAGPAADMVETMSSRIIDPIKSALNMPEVSMPVGIGKFGGLQKTTATPAPIQMMMGFFRGFMKDKSQVAQAAQQTTGGAYAKSLLAGTAMDRVGNDAPFLAEVTRIAQKYEIKESDLLGLMASESGLNPQAQNRSGATGLIQFMPETAESLGTTTDALFAMNRAQQMKYVEKYFDYWKLPKGASAGQLYATVFAPAYASKDNNTALYRRGSEAYAGNAPLDQNNDGVITVGEMGKRVEDKKREFSISDAPLSLTPPPRIESPGPQAPSPRAQSIMNLFQFSNDSPRQAAFIGPPAPTGITMEQLRLRSLGRN